MEMQLYKKKAFFVQRRTGTPFLSCQKAHAFSSIPAPVLMKCSSLLSQLWLSPMYSQDFTMSMWKIFAIYFKAVQNCFYLWVTCIKRNITSIMKWREAHREFLFQQWVMLLFKIQAKSQECVSHTVKLIKKRTANIEGQNIMIFKQKS